MQKVDELIKYGEHIETKLARFKLKLEALQQEAVNVKFIPEILYLSMAMGCTLNLEQVFRHMMYYIRLKGAEPFISGGYTGDELFLDELFHTDDDDEDNNYGTGWNNKPTKKK